MQNILTENTIIEILKDIRVSSGKEHAFINRIIIDSRTPLADKNTLFAAIRTEVNDGHRYIGDLYRRGVRHFMVDCMPDGDFEKATFYVVPNVVVALGSIAGWMGRCHNEIVVTGSMLKTEVKEALYLALLNNGQSVFRSPGSYNSYLGVCLSLFDNYFSGSADNVILEAGIDGPGQASLLRYILRPQTGVITDITNEHDDNFKSHAAKIEEKLELLKDCRRIVYNCDDHELTHLLDKRFGKNSSVELRPVCGADIPALVRETLADMSIPEPRSCALRTDIIPGVRSNVLILHRFTPDKSSLIQGLERLLRFSSPNRRRMLVLGKTIDNPDLWLRENGVKYGLDSIVYLDGNAAEGEDASQGIHNSDILVFGEATEAINGFVSALERADHDTTLNVDLDALVHNFNVFRRMVPAQTGIVAMVKASAYGLGAIEVARALQSTGAAYLAVAVVDEGVEMRQAGITMPVMVMNPMTRHYGALFANRLEPAVFSIEELRRLVSEARRLGVDAYPVHVKLDTGMHRVGFTPDQLPELARELNMQSIVRVKSVFSHLATADTPDKDNYTRAQFDCFYSGTQYLMEQLNNTFKRHILNTAGMMRFADCGPYEMARLGIGMYGISPLAKNDSRLRPVVSLTSVVISLKRLPAGTPIGYGNRGLTTRPSVIATIPVGYADGLDRRLGNGAISFMVNGVECPTIGNICMDQCMVDVTDALQVRIGTPVEIFGRNITVERLANVLGTIPYEVLTSVSPRVHRAYYSK